MRKESTGSRSESRPEWEQLEDWVRSQVQRLIQELLEEEVTAWEASALRSDSDNDTGYPDTAEPGGFAEFGTIQLRRPRVRDTEEQFESRLLPLVNRTRKIAELIPELYLHGLSEGDFDLALRGLLGEDAPVSASTVARLKSKWNDELAQWRSRPLDDLGGVHVGGWSLRQGWSCTGGDGGPERREQGGGEHCSRIQGVHRELVRGAQGHQAPGLELPEAGGWRRTPGHLGSSAQRPQAAEQRCWNHKIVNVLAKLPKRQQDQAKLMLRTIPYAPTRTEAERLRTVFTRWCGDHSYEAASEALERDWDRMVTFYASQRSTGGTFARRTQWNHPSRPSGFGQTPPSATRGSR